MKKFIDNTRHDEPWFVELPIELKAAFDFLWAKCDAAGVWNGSTRIADAQLGKKIDWSALVEHSSGKLVRLASGAFFFPGYVGLQCGELSELSPPHRTVIKLLRNHGLMAADSLTIRLSVSPSNGLLDSPQEEEEDKEKEKTKTPREENSLQGRIPENLKTDAFIAAWNKYIAYRKAARIKPLLDESIIAQWQKLAQYGPAIATEAINASIANGWQGIFPERVKPSAPMNGNAASLPKPGPSRPNRFDDPMEKLVAEAMREPKK